MFDMVKPTVYQLNIKHLAKRFGIGVFTPEQDEAKAIGSKFCKNATLNQILQLRNTFRGLCPHLFQLFNLPNDVSSSLTQTFFCHFKCSLKRVKLF